MGIEEINELLSVEVDICRYYNELCQREMMKQYGPDFTNFIGLIKNAVKKQNEILDKFSIEELFHTDPNAFRKCLEQRYNQVNIDDVISRLSILLTSKLAAKGMSNASDDLFIVNGAQLSAKYIAMGESANIQLSFIDEYLSQANNLSLRRVLCKYKYFLIYVTGTGIEEELMNRYYHTECSIYLTSYLEAKVKNIPASYVDAGKKELAHKTLDSSRLNVYKLVLAVEPDNVVCNSLYGPDLLKASIMLRADLLLLDEKDFEENLNKLGVKKDSPWYKVFLSDRERHKTVSMGTGRTR